MKKTGLIFNLALGIVSILLIVFGFKLSDKYLSSPSDENIKHYKQFCEEGVKTIAKLDSIYTQGNYKVSVLKGSVLSIKYFYLVNGQEYSGERVSNNLPEGTEIEITYLASDPSKSEWIKDICGSYNSLKDKNKSIFYLIIGGIMILLGLGFASNLFSELKKTINKK